ncbi:MAG: hypothetical protein KC636_27990 [Myxococcales bacterium]|nr:hypothetical protein [Myxococcales bacterium]
MSDELSRRLQRYGEALAAEARAATPPPDFADVLARMEPRAGAEVLTLPTAKATAPQRRSGRRAVLWALVGAAACLALVTALSGITGALRGSLGAELRPGDDPSLLSKTADDAKTSGVGVERSPGPRRRQATERGEEAAASSEDAANDAEAGVEASDALERAGERPPQEAAADASARDDAAGVEAPADAGERPTSRRRPASDPKPDKSPWALRNEAALQAWRAGDRARAREIFDDVARRGPARYAQLAYGELSLLTRQLEGVAAQRALWRRYLERFPRGRFADDWSASLCETAPDRDALDCWRRHLAEYPGGAHAAKAREAIDAAR